VKLGDTFLVQLSQSCGWHGGYRGATATDGRSSRGKAGELIDDPTREQQVIEAINRSMVDQMTLRWSLLQSGV
jgi:hypothetical protein